MSFVGYRVPILFQDQRRGVVIAPGKIDNLENLAKEYFKISVPIRIMIKSQNIQVIFSNEVLPTDELFVEYLQEEAIDNENSINKSEELVQQKEKEEIDISILLEKSFRGDKLLADLNDWAFSLLFKLKYPPRCKGLCSAHQSNIILPGENM